MIKKVIFGTKVINHKKFRITSIFFSSIYKVDIYRHFFFLRKGKQSKWQGARFGSSRKQEDNIVCGKASQVSRMIG